MMTVIAFLLLCLLLMFSLISQTLPELYDSYSMSSTDTMSYDRDIIFELSVKLLNLQTSYMYTVLVDMLTYIAVLLNCVRVIDQGDKVVQAKIVGMQINVQNDVALITQNSGYLPNAECEDELLMIVTVQYYI